MRSTHKDISETISGIILMGKSGVGKTTIGTILADNIGWKFIESDSYHSQEDIRRMSTGIPLIDTDRWPRMERLHSLLAEKQASEITIILTCSALSNLIERYYVRISGDISMSI